MRKVLLIIIFVFSIGLTNANPVMPPPMISEIYFDSTSWFIELYYNYVYSGYDSIRLISNSDTVSVSIGNYIQGQVRIINQDSLHSTFYFSRFGDKIEIQIYFPPGDWHTIEEICWGTCLCPYSLHITSPKYGQSLVLQEIEYYDMIDPDITYWLVKDNGPTPGTFIYQAISRGTFSGYVRDFLGNPITNILVQYCSYKMNYYYNNAGLTKVITNNNGYFSNSSMLAKNYDIKFYNINNPLNPILDTIISITIEPDSINYYEFIIDTLLTGIEVNQYPRDYFLSTFPNPTTGETTISFEIPVSYNYSKALIKIYNTNGEIISIIPANTPSHKEKYSVKWNFGTDIPSGIYFCKLVIDGIKVAASKIILTK